MSFPDDVFLSPSSKDQAVVQPSVAASRQSAGNSAERWLLETEDGGALPRRRYEDWAQLESGTSRFRDPLNQERRFLPLRLDGAPITLGFAGPPEQAEQLNPPTVSHQP